MKDSADLYPMCILSRSQLKIWFQIRAINASFHNHILPSPPRTLICIRSIPVKVSRRDGINYVFNGQHTIEIVALVSGSRDTPVWCMIYDELCYEHEADIFASDEISSWVKL